MAEVSIVPARPADADELYLHLREADLRECLAYGKPDVLAGIRESMSGSHICWSAWRDTELLAVFGVAPLSFLTGVGSPWMLGTDALDRHPRILSRVTKPYLTHMLGIYPHLLNFVHIDNARSIRWLKRLGFSFSAPQPYGLRGQMFHRFEMHAHV